jgi:hypothetical protein
MSGSYVLVRTTIDSYMTPILAPGRHLSEDCRILEAVAKSLAAKPVHKTLELRG